jgi:ABC-type lipoprotein release transport system permease subunit
MSVFIAVFLALFIRSMQLGAYDSVIKNVAGAYTGYMQIHAKGFWEDRTLDNAFVPNDSLYNTLRKHKEITYIVPRLETYALIAFDKYSKGVLINGIDINQEKKIKPIEDRLIDGQAFKPHSQEVILTKGIAHYLNAKPGDTIYLIGQGYHGISAAGKFKVAGIADLKSGELNNLVIFMPLKTLQDYLSSPPIITNLLIGVKDYTNIDRLKESLLKEIDSNTYELMTWKEMMPELNQAILADNVGGLYMIFILYMIIAFGIFSTVLMMTEERLFEIGIMTAIGTKKRLIIAGFWLETIFLSLIGVILGVFAAYPVDYYFHVHPLPVPGEKAQLMEQYGFSPQIPFSIDPDIFITHALIILGLSLLAALYPTFKIWRLNTLEALRNK